MWERTTIYLDWTQYELLHLGDIQNVLKFRLCPCTQKPTFTMSTQNGALFLGISNAAQTFNVILRPSTQYSWTLMAPMYHDLAATNLVLTVPSSHFWRTYNSVALAFSDLSRKLWTVISRTPFFFFKHPGTASSFPGSSDHFFHYALKWYSSYASHAIASIQASGI